MSALHHLSLSAAFVLGACATTAGTRPDDMTASEHRREARRHDRIAQRAPYVRNNYFGGYFGVSSWGHPLGGSYWNHGFYPWSYTWSPDWNIGAAHTGEAEQHDVAADVLEKRYRDACSIVAADSAPQPPLDRYVRAVTPTEEGVVLRLSADAGPPDVLLAEIRCHIAWMQLASRPKTTRDLTGVAGVQYTARAEADSIVVTITANDANAIAELRRRAELLVPPVSSQQ